MPQVLTEKELVKLRGVGDRIDLDEVSEVYLPLSRLIHLRVRARQELMASTATFLGSSVEDVPFVIGVAGSVAVGKSTTARLLQVLLQRWESHPRVDLITTDGLLYPAAELNRRGIMNRKGFPESYDQRALLRFVTDVKAGKPRCEAPVYSHTLYDRIPDEKVIIDQPDILIVEGLNVLQTGPTLSPFFGGGTGTPHVQPASAQQGSEYVVVRGDCLWNIAQRILGPNASNATILEYTVRIYQNNRSTIGDNPDLVLPGQRILLPS